MPPPQLNQSLELLCFWNILIILLIVDSLVLGVPHVLAFRLGFLVGSSRFGRSVFKGKGLHFNGIFDVFCIFQVKMEVLMDGLEIRHSLGDSGHEGALSNATSGGRPRLCSSPLLPFLLPLDHLLNTVRKLEISVLGNNLL